jgi:hypothetical protein
MEQAKEQIKELGEFDVMVAEDFNKTVANPDQIESIDWTKWSPNQAVAKQVKLPIGDYG